MPSLFGVDIAGEIASAFAGQLVTTVLIKVTPGTRGANLTAGLQPTDVPYTCNGFIEDRREGNMRGSLVSQGGRIVSILGGSLPAGVFPETTDKVTIEGTTYRIVETGRDPAGALYECRVER